MKRTVTTIIAAAAATFTASVLAGTPISEKELPQVARTFIATHFAGEQVRKAEKEQGRRGMEYEVDLTGGTEIDFMSDGNWKEVKMEHNASVPAAIVPAAIATYVKSNFEGLSIVEIARKRGGYEVELSNGTELKLTEDAKPMQPCNNRKRR